MIIYKYTQVDNGYNLIIINYDYMSVITIVIR